MHTFINQPLQIGSLVIPNRLIQGPLAGYSCAPFRVLFNHFTPPAYCVAEMSSAKDILNKHTKNSRYIYRAPTEQILAYQLSGNDPNLLAQAAQKLQLNGADIIDINCGCPKPKMRKKGVGSALLDTPDRLISIIKEVRTAINIPLTVKIRIQNSKDNVTLAEQIEKAGANALVVHGRRWFDDYDVACNVQQIAQIKQVLTIPIIANGDIQDTPSLKKAIEVSGCDAYMISRAGTGRPWIYQELLHEQQVVVSNFKKITLFMHHLQGLANLESEHKALLQSKSLVRYYFPQWRSNSSFLNQFYQINSLQKIEDFLRSVEFL